jgi:hypothetical protein
MNLTLYGHDGAWIAVYMGITFGGDDFPDHRVMMADPALPSAPSRSRDVRSWDEAEVKIDD